MLQVTGALLQTRFTEQLLFHSTTAAFCSKQSTLHFCRGCYTAALCNSIHLKLLGLRRCLSDKQGKKRCVLEDTSGKKKKSFSKDFCGLFPIEPYIPILAVFFRLSGLEAHKYMPKYTVALEYHENVAETVFKKSWITQNTYLKQLWILQLKMF